MIGHICLLYTHIIDRIMNENIAKINETLAQFFNDPSNPKQILAKELMPLLVKNGIFPSDHRKGLPI